MDDPEGRRFPWPAWDAVRANGGVDRVGPNGEWVVVDHALAIDVLSRPLELSSAAWRDTPEMSLIATDPPDHGPLRRIVRDVLAPEVVDPLAAQVRAVTRELAETLAARREFDAVSELAEPVTERTAARLLEIDERDLSATGAAGPGERNLHAARPGQLASRAAVTDRIPLEPAEAHKLVRFLWLAGIVTTIRHLAWAMLELDRHAELRGRVAGDAAAARAFLDEVLRLRPPSWYVPRVVSVDTTLGDTRMSAGDGVLVVIGAANRDPAVFEDPNRIVLDRPRSPQRVFGHGPHRCPGARLGKLVAEATIDAVLETMPDYRVLQPDAALRYEDGRDAYGLTELAVAPVP
jgi:cytochrome P450